jgi:CHASE2 domain-containing sensor protein
VSNAPDGNSAASRPRRRALVENSVHARLEALLGALSLLVGLLVLARQFPESWWTDARYAIRQDGDFADEVVLVGLDERYVERYGHAASTPISYLTRLVRVAAAQGPATVALDFKVGPAEAKATGFDDFVAAVQDAQRRGVTVVLPTLLARRNGNDVVVRQPPPALADTEGGFVNWSEVAESGGPGILQARDFPVAARLTGNCHMLSFPVSAVASHRRLLPATSARCWGVGTLDNAAIEQVLAGVGVRRPPPRRIALDFIGSVAESSGLTYLSSEEILTPSARSIALAGQLRNKLVLIAAVSPAPDQTDMAMTPYGEVRGGIVHLYAIDTLLRDAAPLRAAPILVLVIAAAVFVAVLGAWRRCGMSALPLTIVGLGTYVLLGFLLFPANLLLPIGWPLWAGLSAAALGFVSYGGIGIPEPDSTAAPTSPSPPVHARRAAGQLPLGPTPHDTEKPHRGSGTIRLVSFGVLAWVVLRSRRKRSRREA